MDRELEGVMEIKGRRKVMYKGAKVEICRW